MIRVVAQGPVVVDLRVCGVGRVGVGDQIDPVGLGLRKVRLAVRARKGPAEDAGDEDSFAALLTLQSLSPNMPSLVAAEQAVFVAQEDKAKVRLGAKEVVLLSIGSRLKVGRNKGEFEGLQ